MTPIMKPFRAGALAIENVVCDTLVEDPRNSRTHSKKQLVKLQAIISEFGFTVPIIIDESHGVIAGHARLRAAKLLGMVTVPCIRIGYLTAAQKRALAIADNRISDEAGWDLDMLRLEFAALGDIEFPVELTGFDTAEIDIIMEDGTAGATSQADPADSFEQADRSLPAVSRPGDLWLLGHHRLLCGDARDEMSYEVLLQDDRASIAITDEPYNVPIVGHVSGLGKVKHREFAMASGEMSPDEFTEFLRTVMVLMAKFSTDGSLHFHFMDWRHLTEITAAGSKAYTELKALCVWNKSNGGMGSLYRSKFELVFVFKNGLAPHVNNIQLGKDGRYRTNVWDYAGVNSFGPSRDEYLAAHPTVKPVAMISDAIRDCSRRGDIVLDPFAGSGTLLLAAERTGRKAAAIELDPHYVDTAVKRWQQATGKLATLSADGATFDDVATAREMAPPSSPVSTVSGESSND